ncbi:MAG: tyrosine-type recombinase/integrase, partial [Phycisphaerae bacterium]
AILQAPAKRANVYRAFLLTGLRRGEMTDLQWGDLRLRSTTPFVQLRAAQTKNGKADQIPLHPDLVAIFSKMRPGKPDGRVFDKIPSKQDLLADIRAAGIKPERQGQGLVDIHSLRHTFDRLVIEKGANVKEAQTLMRHADPKLTMNVYAKMGLQTAAGALNKIQLCAPLMHQTPPILGHCSASSGTTGERAKATRRTGTKANADAGFAAVD